MCIANARASAGAGRTGAELLRRLPTAHYNPAVVIVERSQRASRDPVKLLAIDTATEVCSVALLADDRVESMTEVVGQSHSDRALPMIDRVLANCGVSLKQLDAIAFGAGPGSFTGLRIACGLAQGLAFGAEKPVLAIGNLRALAARAFTEHPQRRRILVAIDARMNEAYCAVYAGDDAVTELAKPALAAPAALLQLAEDFEVDLMAGNALSVFGVQLPAGLIGLPELRAGAADIVRLARHDWHQGLARPASEAAPIYVRDRVALTVSERRNAAVAR